MTHPSLRYLLWLAGSFLPIASPAPAAVPSAPPAILPPGSTGSLRGSLGFVGPDSNPIDPGDTAVVSSPEIVPGQDADPKLGLYLDFTKVQNPQPLRGNRGATDPGHRKFFKIAGQQQVISDIAQGNADIDRQNSDLFAAPATDSGDMPNAKWDMGLSHNRLGLGNAGWARQQNVGVLPEATEMAGVDMSLAPHGYRELHWHKAAEWSLILNGSCRVQATNEFGEAFVDDVEAGDVWFFPPGTPHSIQALDQGVEFLLVFDDGDFSEENTFLVSEMFLRNPKSVIAKNFRTDIPSLSKLPTDQLWIFPGTAAPKDIKEQNVTGPAGFTPPERAYTYHSSQQKPLEVPGGSVKIVDPQTFPVAAMFSTAVVTIKPGAMRELHWHLTSDEWNFFLQGRARTTVFSAPASSRTFDFNAGDVGYIPVAESHYMENIGDEDVVFLEVLQAPRYNDISVSQWLGITPKQIVKDHLGLPDEVLDNLPKYKQFIVPGDTNMTQTNFTSTTPK